MSLGSGARIGVYEIGSLLGAGGMGEVYRARDTRLGRDVAIKVLPAAVAMDPERLARFEREARVLASLNHPNIGAIYGVEESSGLVGLVLELVDGETLANRITKGSGRRAQGFAIPIAEALTIARQIAEALDAAHERGIVHRDLKPANIVITADGTVKVLDFGLAKARAGEAIGAGAELTRSPTVIAPTIDGMLLGTAPYMSPEQARGKVVDKRADIWAFGCVLYEMLTGRHAVGGETIADTVAAILEREPDWRALPAATPPHLVRALRRCLEKDPRRRVRDIADVQIDLNMDEAPGGALPTRAVSPRWFSGALAFALIASLAALAWLWISRPAHVRQAIQFTFGPPEDEQLDSDRPVPSPDGSSIAFVARSAARQRSIWIRHVGRTELRRLGETDGVVGAPFWSPDGAWVGFVAEGKLRKVPAAGGPSVTICASPGNLGATWNRDNVIVLAPTNRTTLFSVTAGGGTPTPITTLNAGHKENSHRWPQFLPDGRHFLFTARSDVIENTVVYLGSLGSKTITPLLPAQSNASYASGYLLFAREGTLMARRFDAATLTLSGEAFAVGPRVAHVTPSASAAFGMSLDGRVLAYQGGARPNANLTWFDRSGTALGTVGKEDEFTELRMSPNATLAAVVIPDRDSGNRDIWLTDLRSGTLTRFTSNPSNDWQPVWSPDGRRIAFASDRNGQSSIYLKALDGGDEELLLQVPNHGAFPLDWSKDGSVLTVNIDNAAGLPTMAAMRLAGDRTSFPAGPAPESSEEAMLTRDARWVTFVMSQAGVDDVYVAPFPRGAPRRISVGGGSIAQWKADDSELYFAALDGSIMAAPVRRGSTLEVGTPVRLFRPCGSGLSIAPSPLYMYDATADGSRFLTICHSPSAIPSAITVSVDWTATLK